MAALRRYPPNITPVEIPSSPSPTQIARKNTPMDQFVDRAASSVQIPVADPRAARHHLDVC